MKCLFCNTFFIHDFIKYYGCCSSICDKAMDDKERSDLKTNNLEKEMERVYDANRG